MCSNVKPGDKRKIRPMVVTCVVFAVKYPADQKTLNTYGVSTVTV